MAKNDELTAQPTKRSARGTTAKRTRSKKGALSPEIEKLAQAMRRIAESFNRTEENLETEGIMIFPAAPSLSRPTQSETSSFLRWAFANGRIIEAKDFRELTAREHEILSQLLANSKSHLVSRFDEDETTSASEPKKKRVFGAYKGKIDIGPEFFDPLSPEDLKAWSED